MEKYVPAPAGLHAAVCVDVVDLGTRDTPWGQRRKVELRWQTEKTMADGKPYLVTKKYTNSLHPKATLRAHLESWRGRGLTDVEAEEFDLEKLLDANCQLTVTHVKMTSGDPFAKVVAIVPPAKGQRLQQHGYTRVANREGYVPPPSAPDLQPPYEPPPEDDDIPF